MTFQKIHIPNNRGEMLSARLELPPGGKPLAYALFAHCFTCGKNLRAARHISLGLTHAGFGVLRFDFTGLGESEGDFGDTHFSSNMDDLVAASSYLTEHYAAPSVFIGHSLGGTASLFAAPRVPSVKAIATIGAPSSPEHVARLLRSSIDEIQRTGEAVVEIGGRPFKIRKEFLDDLERADMLHGMGNLRAAVLFMHAPQDTIVGIDNAEELYRHSKHPKSFVSLDGADHLMSDPRDALYAGSVIAAWAERYIPVELREQDHAETDIIARTGASEYTTEIQSGSHSIVADEAIAAGGNDLGPTPHNLLSASLAACTSMTLRMYADRKQWDVREIRTRVRHGKVRIENPGEPDTVIGHFERVLEIEGELDTEQRARLLEIANKCPVHKTLSGAIRIETNLAGPD